MMHKAFGSADGDVVQVQIDNGGRELIFADVIVRVSPAYRLELHLDTDEANAAGIGDGGAAGHPHEAIQAILVKQ